MTIAAGAWSWTLILLEKLMLSYHIKNSPIGEPSGNDRGEAALIYILKNRPLRRSFFLREISIFLYDKKAPVLYNRD
ncbi:hypothetical protein [Bacillus marinisedimentorum]|uniref:hypothetical protein n=1 Tax=Bacillus marinisedimentorum TaxID=1821260 RepID=UPI0008723921|nr:hypothetical protein [Bacillus marinisedimentorum]